MKVEKISQERFDVQVTLSWEEAQQLCGILGRASCQIGVSQLYQHLKALGVVELTYAGEVRPIHE